MKTYIPISIIVILFINACAPVNLNEDLATSLDGEWLQDKGYIDNVLQDNSTLTWNNAANYTVFWVFNNITGPSGEYILKSSSVDFTTTPGTVTSGFDLSPAYSFTVTDNGNKLTISFGTQDVIFDILSKTNTTMTIEGQLGGAGSPVNKFELIKQ